jgi:hypothetical protein
MKRAQNVAQAVVKTRSSLSSWSCMGARRRHVGPLLESEVEDLPEAALVSERNSESAATDGITRDPLRNKVERNSSSGGSGHDDTDEDEHLLPEDGVISVSTVEDITEGELLFELERELQRQENEADIRAQEEEAAAAKEITEEENILVDAVVESSNPISSADDVSESHQFYPPGRIMHIVSVPSSDTPNIDNGTLTEEHVGIFETPRELYSKLRLSKTMINDHYMPMYKKMMEMLIRELENEEPCGSVM